MANYLLVGGNGFIGTNLALRLSNVPNNEIKIMSRSSCLSQPLRDRDNIELFEARSDSPDDLAIELKGIDVVVYLASSLVPATSSSDGAGMFPDVPMLVKLLNACAVAGIARFVFFSSSAVYGNGLSPFEENSPTWPVSVYGNQKLAMERIVNLFRYEKGLDCVIVRPSNPYGPYQKPGIQGVIGAFVDKAISSEDLVIVGDGSIERDFIYIDDLVEAVCGIIDYRGDEFVFNVGSGRSTSIRDAAKAVIDAIPTSAGVSNVASRASDAQSNVLDISRFNEEIGAIRYTSLEEGIARTYAYQMSLLG